MNDDHLAEKVDVRIFPLQKEFLKQLCERYPDEYPNESAAIRAAITVFRRWLAQNQRWVD